MHTLAVIALFQMAAAANSAASVANPNVGYALKGSHLMKFTGIPGACQVSPDPTGTPYTSLQTASVAPVSILLSADGSKLFYLNGDGTLTVSLPEPAANTAISPTGNYFVALYTSRLQLFNRSGSPVATAELSASGIRVSDVMDVLVNDQGEILLSGPNTFWYSAKNAESFTPIPMALTFARFMPHDHLIIAYDAGQGRLIAVHPASAFAVEPLITMHDGLTPVSGLSFGADGTSVWVTQQNGPLLRYNIPTRTTTSFSVPTGVLSNTLAPGVFLWNQPGASNVILDTTRPEPTVLLVPTGSN